MSHRQKQVVQRLFGPDAVLDADIGVRGVTGEFRIVIGGAVFARAETFAELLHVAQRRARLSC